MAEEAVAVQQSLAGLTRTMSMHMEKISNSTVSFRETAAQHNKNISNVVKDVFTAIAGQRRELSETNDNLEESFSGIKQGLRDNARSTDAVGDGMNQVLSVQYKTLGELSLLNRNMNSLIYNTSGSILGDVFGKIFGDTWFGRLGTTFANSLKTILPLGIAGGAAYMAGQTGPGGDALTSSFQWGTGPENVNMKAAAEAIKDIESKSSGGYKAQNPTSSASGAYQFIDTTWQSAAASARIGTEYKRAVDAPPEIQDAVFNDYFQKLVKKEGLKNAVLTHFLGPKHTMSASAQANNITPESYINRFEKGYSRYSNQSSTASATPTGTVTPTTPATSTTNNTTNITNTENPDPGRQALPTGVPTAIGPVGNYKREENREQTTQAGVMGASLPKSDIISLGHALQQQGLRISEHPQFGGVSNVHKGRAHYEGRAIDINVGTGVTEATDPAIGARFDKLADQLTAAGYKVYWRESGKYGASGHNNHLHAEVLPGGRTPEAPATATTPTGQMTPTTPATPGLAVPGISQETPTTNITNFQQYAQEQFAKEAETVSSLGIPGMMGGGMGMGMGSIMGLLGPVLGSLGQGIIQPAVTQQMAEQLQPKQEIANVLQAAAIEDKVMQTMQRQPPEIEQRETEASQFMQSPDRHFPAGSFGEYNTDNHIYPDWNELTHAIYGPLTGPNGGNIKTHL